MCVAVVLCGDESAEVLKFESDNNPDGSYQYQYETSNGISGQESGVGGESATGEFKWISPEGTPVEIQYVADAEGYRATGDAVPVGPAVPAHVARLLEWIATHPSDDDGSYKA